MSFLQRADNNQRFAQATQQSSVSQQTADDGALYTNVDQPSSETNTGGVPYAMFNKPSTKSNRTNHDTTDNRMKNKKVCT